MVRVGGGYESIDSFVKKNRDREQRKVNAKLGNVHRRSPSTVSAGSSTAAAAASTFVLKPESAPSDPARQVLDDDVLDELPDD